MECNFEPYATKASVRTQTNSWKVKGRMTTPKLAALLPCLIFLSSFVLSAPSVASWAVSADQRNGLPKLTVDGITAVSADFVFWRKNWAWADLTPEFKVVAPFEYVISGTNVPLNFQLAGHARKTSSSQMVWQFELNAATTTLDVIGGGISFRLNLAEFRPQLGDPELLPGNRGWAWGRQGGNRLQLTFDPPVASLYFERDQKDEIRAFVYKGEVTQGARRYIVTLSVSGDVTIDPSTLERFGLEDPGKWLTNILDWQISPVDLSFLNAPEKPAGKRGFVKAIQGKLMFEDGIPARFWGTNLAAYSLFGSPRREDMRLQARRLSQLGFNLVRLHHHDSPWVTPNIFRGNSPDTQALSEDMLARLDWWIKCLKDEGIYIFLDLHAQRHFKPGDGINDFDEIARGGLTADLKGFNYINASIRDAMQRFNAAYVTHVNQFTGLRYKDDPAIIAMLLTNENDLTHHFGNALLPDKKVPKHTALYMAQAEKFATEHGLAKERTWRSWEPGPSKIFLNDLENRFNASMIGHLRSLGVKVPIVTTSSWGHNPLSSLPTLATGDLIAVHSYGGTGEIERNPVYGPNMTHWMAAAQVAGKPLCVPEWNASPFPIPDRHTLPLYIAASARLQGWDAVMQYAYSQQPMINAGAPSNWDAFNDPALVATLPAAALLYRRGDVHESATTYAFAPTANQLFNEPISPANSVALRTASERGKLVIVLPQTTQLPWLNPAPPPSGAILINDPRVSLLHSSATGTYSDSGELYRDWDGGTYTINTPRTQAAMGWIGNRDISLTDVRMSIHTRNATISVQSLDAKEPIHSTHAILISLGARSVPAHNNRLPYLSEPVIGRLSIKARQGLRLIARLAPSNEERQFTAPYIAGRYEINLDSNLGAYWLMLK
jgi:hypothetical protein